MFLERPGAVAAGRTVQEIYLRDEYRRPFRTKSTQFAAQGTIRKTDLQERRAWGQLNKGPPGISIIFDPNVAFEETYSRVFDGSNEEEAAEVAFDAATRCFQAAVELGTKHSVQAMLQYQELQERLR